MQAQDRPEFDRQMARLCAAYSVQPGDRPDAYWQAFGKLGLIEFARMVEYALGPDGPDRMPSVHVLWGIRKSFRSSAPIQHHEMPPHGDALDGWANRIMFGWLSNRVSHHGPLSDDDLRRVIAAKQEELNGMRLLIVEKDPEATTKRFVCAFRARADAIADHAAAD